MYCTLKYHTQLGNLLSWICITVYTISVYMYCGVMTTWNLALVLEESWVRHWPLVSISISIAFLARREVVVLLFGVVAPVPVNLSRTRHAEILIFCVEETCL